MKLTARKDLDAHRTQALILIDSYAEAVRQQGVSSSQSAIYGFKLEEARWALGCREEHLDPDAYPFLRAEIGITGDSVHAVAQKVIDAHEAWRTRVIEVECKRLAAKAIVRGSSDVAEMQATAQSMLHA